MLKHRFPIFKEHPDLVFLDSASTSQRVDVALAASEHYALHMNANVHRALYPMGEAATEAYEGVREIAAKFVNARGAGEIVFTSGTTDSLNLVASSWGRKFLKEGDEVLLSMLEHHSNLVPWQQVALERGAVLKFIPITDEGLLDESALEDLVTAKTKMISVTALSNTLGTVVNIPNIVKLARKMGALVCVDAAQWAAHAPIDVQEWDVDFLAFSGHKIYSETGVGVLYAKGEHLEAMPPYRVGGSMIREVSLEATTWAEAPQKFEAGTPNIAGVLSMGAAMEFLRETTWDAIQKYDKELMDLAFAALKEITGLRILGPGNSDLQKGVFSFVMEGIHPHDISAILGLNNICVRAGHHCSMPLLKKLGLAATARVSFGVYNTAEDIHKLVEGLKKVSSTLK